MSFAVASSLIREASRQASTRRPAAAAAAAIASRRFVSNSAAVRRGRRRGASSESRGVPIRVPPAYRRPSGASSSSVRRRGGGGGSSSSSHPASSSSSHHRRMRRPSSASRGIDRYGPAASAAAASADAPSRDDRERRLASERQLRWLVRADADLSGSAARYGADLSRLLGLSGADAPPSMPTERGRGGGGRGGAAAAVALARLSDDVRAAIAAASSSAPTPSSSIDAGGGTTTTTTTATTLTPEAIREWMEETGSTYADLCRLSRGLVLGWSSREEEDDDAATRTGGGGGSGGGGDGDDPSDVAEKILDGYVRLWSDRAELASLADRLEGRAREEEERSRGVLGRMVSNFFGGFGGGGGVGGVVGAGKEEEGASTTTTARGGGGVDDPNLVPDSEVHLAVMKSALRWGLKGGRASSSSSSGGGSTGSGSRSSAQERRRRRARVADRVLGLHDRMVRSSAKSSSSSSLLLLRPDRRTTMFAMKCQWTAGTFEHAERAEALLREMIRFQQRRQGDPLPSKYRLSLAVYHNVLRAYRKAAIFDRTDANRRKSALSADRLLAELERDGKRLLSDDDSSAIGDDEDSNEDDMAEEGSDIADGPAAPPSALLDPTTSFLWQGRGRGPNVASYNLALQCYAKAGHKAIPDLATRVDRLMVRFVGDEAFRSLMEGRGDDGGGGGDGDARNVPPVHHAFGRPPDMMTLHHLVEIYASSNDRARLETAKRILGIMEQERERNAPRGTTTTAATGGGTTPFPNAFTYNALIRGLLRSDGPATTEDASVLEDARYATSLLDAMVRHRPSYPNRGTFHYLLWLWTKTRSAEAGERGEDVLSRMEIRNAYAGGRGTGSGSGAAGVGRDEAPDRTSYRAAIDCWATSAAAGAPASFRRALALLDKADAQRRPALPTPSSSNLFVPRVYNDAVEPDAAVYTAVVRACANTRIESEKPPALRAAFDVYNRMIDDGVRPTPDTYARLLDCCAHLLPLPPPSPRDSVATTTTTKSRSTLTRTVFESAREQGAVDGHVLQALKKADEKLHAEYRRDSSRSSSL